MPGFVSPAGKAGAILTTGLDLPGTKGTADNGTNNTAAITNTVKLGTRPLTTALDVENGQQGPDVFLEKIMTDSLENHEGTVRIGGRIITNLRFADDIDGLDGKEAELENLVKTVETASTAYGMEISPEKSKDRVKQSEWPNNNHQGERLQP